MIVQVAVSHMVFAPENVVVAVNRTFIELVVTNPTV
jgi:hypothetical protein